MTETGSIKIKKHMTAGQILILGFLAVIFIGTTLLTLPISSRSGEFTSVRTAMFTSVSATCVTGLIIEDTALHWSPFGQTVIICMIQIGGLGFMTMTVLFSMLIRRTITPRERIIISQSLGLNTNSGMIKLVKRILIGTFVIEGLGAVLLSTRFVPIFGWRDGILKGIFHSISAFCNAGFDLLGTYSGAYSSVAAFGDDPAVMITFVFLILIGGIGFIVWDDIYDFVTKRDPITAYTKFILLCSAILLFGGAAVILLLEYGNPETLGKLPFGEKLLAAFFHSMSTRTAGFAAIDNTLFTDAGKAFSMFLMLIGGASGSTAGGVKVGTACLIIYTVFRVAMGHSDIVLFKRKVSNDNILRAVSITGIVMILIVVVALVISSVDGVRFIDAIYEAVSAAATVGLSCGLTPSLSLISHILLMVLMFFGRVGILTVTYSIMLRITSKSSVISYPETYMLIG